MTTSASCEDGFGPSLTRELTAVLVANVHGRLDVPLGYLTYRDHAVCLTMKWPRSPCDREEEPDDTAVGMKSIESFMVQPKKKMRSNFFVARGLERVDTF